MAAKFELALYAARDGKWQDAAGLVAQAEPERAALFRAAARLAEARGADAELALARFLSAHAGELLPDGDYGFYRGMSYVADATSAQGIASAEYQAVAQALVRMSERFRALELFEHWLTRNASRPNARAVLAEADRTYARLLYEGGDDYARALRARPGAARSSCAALSEGLELAAPCASLWSPITPARCA